MVLYSNHRPSGPTRNQRLDIQIAQIEYRSDPYWLDIKMAVNQDRLLARIISDLSDNRRRKLQGLAVEYLSSEWNELGFDTILR